MRTACRICGAGCESLFEHAVLRVHRASYSRCPQCGFVQAEEPSWLAEAHASPLSDQDTGLVSRNLWLLPRVAALLVLARETGSVCVDMGGGCGLFTRLMRDVGFDCYWQDRYSANVLARGFSAEGIAGPVGLVTLFEVLEHSPDPLGLLREAVDAYRPRLVLTMTEVFERDPPSPDWPYYAFESGQHVSFFSRKAMETAATKLGLHVVFAGGCQLLSVTPFPPLLFRLAMSRAAPFAFPALRRTMTSRVQSDHEALVRRAGRSR
ncbi:MAG TPA: class I SAM-dependent methyltransferase [Usitatibacter sp.]|nr:class I SAM-dependent methyltransferase [Usitatibacter sp.]